MVRSYGSTETPMWYPLLYPFRREYKNRLSDRSCRAGTRPRARNNGDHALGQVLELSLRRVIELDGLDGVFISCTRAHIVKNFSQFYKGRWGSNPEDLVPKPDLRIQTLQRPDQPRSLELPRARPRLKEQAKPHLGTPNGAILELLAGSVNKTFNNGSFLDNSCQGN